MLLIQSVSAVTACILFLLHTAAADCLELPEQGVGLDPLRSSLWAGMEASGYQPQPRWGHASITVGSKVYMWGGRTEAFSEEEKEEVSEQRGSVRRIGLIWFPSLLPPSPSLPPSHIPLTSLPLLSPSLSLSLLPPSPSLPLTYLLPPPSLPPSLLLSPSYIRTSLTS